MASGHASGKKDRLDKLMVDRGLCPTRAKAQGLILAGEVTVDGQRVDKPGTLFSVDAPLQIVIRQESPFVSRGGHKLEKALQEFQIPVAGRICLDAGASTGGFTDCLLQSGAAKVYAVDVGYGQLDWKLRQDPRVVVFEKTNIRYLESDKLPDAPAVAVADVSFISIVKILPHVSSLLQADEQGSAIITLIKPQFEYKDYMDAKNFKGVVQGQAQHRTILTGVLSELTRLMPEWPVTRLDFSPLTGPKGNIEYLAALEKRDDLPPFDLDSEVARIITESYKAHGL